MIRNDVAWVNRACLVLVVVLIACMISPVIENVVGWVLVGGLGGALALVVLRELFAEIDLAWELRDCASPPHPDDVTAWKAQQPAAASTASTLHARPVWEVVPPPEPLTDGPATLELEP